MLFKDYSALFLFDDVSALEHYVNTALRRLTRTCRASIPQGSPSRIDFNKEALCFYDADPAERNFLFDPESRELWLVDYQDVGVLPYPFAVFAIEDHRSPFVNEFAEELGLANEWIPLMRRASGRIAISGHPTFGIKYTPKDGETEWICSSDEDRYLF
ncbi:hypothetical protein BD413DRAFT_141051 [Trametes elegans]|nr:hypothetical protein BD413DRAFT_141051 [Trametes elegans]